MDSIVKNCGTITNKKVILRLQEVLECIDLGVLEYWSIGVLKEYIKPSASTPTLQYSNAPKLIII
jgi:hypothetical protein